MKVITRIQKKKQKQMKQIGQILIIIPRDVRSATSSTFIQHLDRMQTRLDDIQYLQTKLYVKLTTMDIVKMEKKDQHVGDLLNHK